MTTRLPLDRIAVAYEALLIDQYGVLHDGHRPYPGAVDTLARLRALGLPVAVLSNSGRSGEENARRMERLGFTRDLYDRVVTSGDVATSHLQGPDAPVPPGPATRCLSLSTGAELGLSETLGYTPVPDGSAADLVVIGGSEGERVGLAAYGRMLEPAARRGAPCLCTNPDRLMLTGEGTTFGAGRIAELYEELGGRVTWIGKPFPMIYARAAALLGVTEPSAVLCVGDSVQHDIAGARGFGAACVLVRTGILADLPEAELAQEMARFGVVPDYVLPGLG